MVAGRENQNRTMHVMVTRKQRKGKCWNLEKDAGL